MLPFSLTGTCAHCGGDYTILAPETSPLAQRLTTRLIAQNPSETAELPDRPTPPYRHCPLCDGPLLLHLTRLVPDASYATAPTFLGPVGPLDF